MLAKRQSEFQIYTDPYSMSIIAKDFGKWWIGPLLKWKCLSPINETDEEDNNDDFEGYNAIRPLSYFQLDAARYKSWEKRNYMRKRLKRMKREREDMIECFNNLSLTKKEKESMIDCFNNLSLDR